MEIENKTTYFSGSKNNSSGSCGKSLWRLFVGVQMFSCSALRFLGITAWLSVSL